MSSVDPLLLARIQFAANISFHILFPMVTIALAWVLLYFRWRYARSGDARWIGPYQFWVKVFALTFALGVVSGITMSFQFGTNWPGFMETVGNVAGPFLAYEVLTAFFLEATFLSIMLFGMHRVSTRLHLTATALVAIGTTLSAFWILALNSWMHTPVGYEMIDGKAHVTDWLAVVFNPSFPYRLTHTLLASGLTVAFLIAGMSAWRWLNGQRGEDVRTEMRTAVVLAALLAPAQMFVGDLHGLNTLEHQPAKVAAMEGLWETREGAPLVLFGLPDPETRTNRFAVELPNVASLILTHEWNGKVQGIEAFGDEHPPVAAVFWAFRIMVGTGIAMLLLSWTGAWLTRAGRAPPRWLARALVAMTFSGWVAVLSGWYTTEIGRQPWLVHGVLRTADAAAAIPASNIGITLTGYLVTYVVLLVAYISALYLLARRAGAKTGHTPDETHRAPPMLGRGQEVSHA